VQHKRKVTVRGFYGEALDEHLKAADLGEYDKGTSRLYVSLGQERLATAIRYARRLLDAHDAGMPFHQRIPATTVHVLVCALLANDPYLRFNPCAATAEADDGAPSLEQLAAWAKMTVEEYMAAQGDAVEQSAAPLAAPPA
jgi:hypothetical protein